MARFARLAAVPMLACALLLGACTSWHARPVSQPGAGTFVAKRARVTRADGTSLVVADARVRNDTLSGTVENGGAPVSLALADVRRVEVRRPNELANVLLITFAAAAVTVALLAGARPTLAC